MRLRVPIQVVYPFETQYAVQAWPSLVEIERLLALTALTTSAPLRQMSINIFRVLSSGTLVKSRGIDPWESNVSLLKLD
jgi:hypothetical protein